MEILDFVTLPSEIPDKMKLQPWKFHKIVFHPLEFPRPKTKTHGKQLFQLKMTRFGSIILHMTENHL